MALMGTGLRDTGKYVEQGGRGRVQKKHGIKEREQPLRQVKISKYFCHMDEQISMGKAVIK